MAWNTNGFIFMRNHPLNIVITVKKKSLKRKLANMLRCIIQNRTDDIFVGLLTM